MMGWHANGGAAKWSGSEVRRRIEWCSGGERGGLGEGRGLREELVEVLAGELPLERRRDLLVSPAGGTLSASNGLRLPMRGKSLTARALSRYFVDEGVTSNTHVSDQ